MAFPMRNRNWGLEGCPVLSGSQPKAEGKHSRAAAIKPNDRPTKFKSGYIHTGMYQYQYKFVCIHLVCIS